MHTLLRQLLSLSCLFVFLSVTNKAIAQKNSIKGTVVDTAEKKNLSLAIVALIDLKDTTLYRSVRSFEGGKFEIEKIPPGKYTLIVSYPKMADFLKDITVTDTSQITIDKVVMVTQATLLKEVVVTAGVPIRMKGDTLEYNADSFAVKPGANVEELLKRLPGMYVERDGKIYAQGKEVEKILVDGDEFFSDDPGLATKYLRAESVEKVQVFDGKSEQSQFTGIDDGKRTKTINLKLKKDKKNGAFGKLSAGADGKDYYQHDAMAAFFRGNKKASIFGMASKIGNTAFDYGEINKYVNQDYEVIDDGTGNLVYHSNEEYEGNWGSTGLPSVLYGGAHFSDKWNNNKQKLFANYRVKETKTTDWNTNFGTNILSKDTSFTSRGGSTSNAYNLFQKGSASFTTAIDSFSTLKISVNGSIGENNRFNNSYSSTVNQDSILVNENETDNRSFNKFKKFGTNLNYQRRFRKEGRTLTVSFQQDYSMNDNENYAESNTDYYDEKTGAFKRKDLLNQLQRSSNPWESYAAKAQFTDKLSKSFNVSAEYGWKKVTSSNVFNTYKEANGKYEERLDSLSNDYDFAATTHITGATIAWHNKKMSVTTGSKVFISKFDQANNDLKTNTTRNFINWAPSIGVNWRVEANSYLNLSYNGQTSQPSVEQLQPLRRTSNNLYIQEGNPDLDPEFRHNLNFYYYSFNMKNQSNINVGGSVNYTERQIVSQSTIDAQGRTVSKYINLDGIASYSAYFNFSWYFKDLHLRPGFRSYLGRNGNYVLQNNNKYRNESYYSNINISVNHDWKDVMSTGYSAGLNFNTGKSDIPGQTARKTFTHTHNVTNTFYIPWKIELNSNINFSFQPKNSSFNTDFNNITWNAFIQKKLLKNDQGIIKFSVNDILNRNTGYSRSVWGSNINESDRFVIKRYFLLTAIWNFTKNF